MMLKTLALFDFDGTLTRGDSLVEFLWHLVGLGNAAAKTPEVLLHWMTLGVRMNLSHDTAKEALLRAHMPKRTRAEWDQLVRKFYATRDARYFNDNVLGALRQLRASGAEVAIVSASIDIWLQPIADREGVDLICTRSAWQDERWTGFAGKNCRGAEKVRRIQEAYPLEVYDRIVAYGNTSSDYPMLGLATEAWMVRRSGRLVRWD